MHHAIIPIPLNKQMLLLEIDAFDWCPFAISECIFLEFLLIEVPSIRFLYLFPTFIPSIGAMWKWVVMWERLSIYSRSIIATRAAFGISYKTSNQNLPNSYLIQCLQWKRTSFGNDGLEKIKTGLKFSALYPHSTGV